MYAQLIASALDLSPPLPLTAGVLDKWLAEPTRQIFLPASTFIANAKSYPVLPKGTQSFIRDIMKVSAYTQPPPIPFVIERSFSYNPRSSFQGLTPASIVAVGRRLTPNILDTSRKLVPGCRLWRNLGLWRIFRLDIKIIYRRRFRFVAVFILFVNNRCYCALDHVFQPLADNLPSTTYQTFEQDPVKYANYEEATFRALLEWPKTDERMCVLLVNPHLSRR